MRILFIINIFIITTQQHLFANDFELYDFFAPKNGTFNIYSCEYPCKYIEIYGILLDNNKEIKLAETTYYLDNNETHSIKNEYILYITKTKIYNIHEKNKNIILQTPLKIGNTWNNNIIIGINNKTDNNITLEKIKYKLKCSIVSIENEVILHKKRNVITVNCSSNTFNNDIHIMKYATGLGLIQKGITDRSIDNILNYMILKEVKTNNK